MQRKRHSPEQIIRKLREAEVELGGGAAVADVCKKLGISEQTYFRWRNQYGGLKADDMSERTANGDLAFQGLSTLIND